MHQEVIEHALYRLHKVNAIKYLLTTFVVQDCSQNDENSS